MIGALAQEMKKSVDTMLNAQPSPEGMYTNIGTTPHTGRLPNAVYTKILVIFERYSRKCVKINKKRLK